MKLPNGAGSVTKLKGRRYTPYWARISIGYDENNNLIRKSLGTFKTKKEALEALVNYQEDANPNNYTLQEIFDMYKKERIENDMIKETTIESYEDNFKHLKPLSNRRFRDLNVNDYQEVFNNMKRLNSKKDTPISKESKKRIKSVLSNLYTYALKHEIVDKDISIFIELGRGEQKEEKDIFSDIHIKKLFDNVNNIQDLDIMLIFIYTGLRPSELLNLTKDNIDLERRVIFDFGIKTEKGKKRIMPIADKIFDFVEKRYNSANPFLFTTGTGNVMKTNYYRRYRFDPAIKELGFDNLNITPYSTRHTFATLMDRGKIRKTLQKDLMGHTDYATTVNNYTHSDLEELRLAINKI